MPSFTSSTGDDTVCSADWTFQGFQVVQLQNAFLRVEVLPDFGGKIWSLEHRPSGRQFLWQHPRHRLRSLPLGANYDDHFFGGFDELLPNDLPEQVNGDALVDHGELWTTPLSVQTGPNQVVLEGILPITPLAYRKALRLEQRTLILEYRLENRGRRPLDLLWKLHPALRISPGAEVLVPARRARVADPQWSRVKDKAEFAWAEMQELHRVPPMGTGTEFLYLLDLADGHCALRHVEENWSFRLSFPREVFSSVWIFASFGGWRDLEFLILEPCTAPQLSLAACSRDRTCLHLEPGAALEATVRVEAGPIH